MKNIIKTSIYPLFLSILMLISGIFCFTLPKTVLAEDTEVVAEEGTIEVGEGSCILDFYLVNNKIPAFRARYKTEKEVEEGGNQEVTPQIAGADEYGRYKDATDEDSSTEMSTVLSNFTIGIDSLGYLATASMILGYIGYPVNGYSVSSCLWIFFKQSVCEDWWDNGGTLSLYARWEGSGSTYNFTFNKLDETVITAENQSVFVEQTFMSNGASYDGYLPTRTIGDLYNYIYSGQYWQIVEVNGEEVCGNIYDSSNYMGDALFNIGAPAGADIVLRQVDVTQYTFKMYKDKDETTVFAEATKSAYGSPLPTISSAITNKTPSKDYYYFDGWDYTDEAGNVHTFKETATIASIVKVLTEEDKANRTINLYAHWQGYDYSVTFDGANTQYFEYSSDAKINKITDIKDYEEKLSGYQFMGWTTDANFAGAYSNINYTYSSESDIINIAKKAAVQYQKNKYVVCAFVSGSFTYADGVLTNTTDSETTTLIKDEVLLSDLVTLANASETGGDITLYSVWFDTWANHTEAPTVTDMGEGESAQEQYNSNKRDIGRYYIMIENENQLAWLADWINNPQDVELPTSSSEKLEIYNKNGRMYWEEIVEETVNGETQTSEIEHEIMVYISHRTYNLSNYLWIPMGTKTNPCRMRLCDGYLSSPRLLNSHLYGVVKNMTILNPVGNARDYSGFWGKLAIDSTGYVDDNGKDWLQNYYINMDIKASYVEGGMYTGALVGYSTETAQYFGSCVMTNISVKGGDYTGGLVGYSAMDIDNPKITYSKVSGKNCTGGLVGDLQGEQRHIFTLTADNIVVTGENFVGGMYGVLSYVYKSIISNSTVTGGKYVGGVAGIYSGLDTNHSKVENVTVNGDIAGGCFGTIGEIFSLSDGTITNSLNVRSYDITVSGLELYGYQYAGGVVGYVAGSPFSSSSSLNDIKLLLGTVEGKYAGGFVGRFDASGTSPAYISNVKNLGVLVSGDSYVGGIVGYIATNSNMYIQHCQNYTLVQYRGNVGGIVGCIEANSSIQVYFSYCCNYEYVDGEDSVGGIVGLITGNSSISKLQFEICYNYGDILNGVSVGGILGKISVNDADCTFNCCYNSGTIKSNDWLGNLCLGGIVGYIANSGKSNVEIKNTVSRGSVNVYYGSISYPYEYNLGSLIGDIEKSTSYYYHIHDCYVASNRELLGTSNCSDKVDIYSVLRTSYGTAWYYLRGNDATTSASNIDKDFSNWTYIQGWETPLPCGLVGSGYAGYGIIGGVKYNINDIIKYGSYTSGGSWSVDFSSQS